MCLDVSNIPRRREARIRNGDGHCPDDPGYGWREASCAGIPRARNHSDAWNEHGTLAQGDCHSTPSRDSLASPVLPPLADKRNLQNEQPSVHPPDFVQGWELCGRAAIRKANWKAVFIPKPKGPGTWQLYNLSRDPGEIHDLADLNPSKLEELLVHWDDYVRECGVIPLQPELGAYLDATEEQMPVSTSTPESAQSYVIERPRS